MAETTDFHALTDDCLALGDKVRELRNAPADKREGTWERDLRNAVTELRAADAELSMRSRIWENEQAQRQGPRAATGAVAQAEYRTAGELFANSAEILDWAKRGGGRGTSPAIEIERRTLATTGTSSNDAGALLPKGSPFLSPGAIDQRRLYIRDLVAQGNTTLNSVPYVREYLPRTNETAATGVVEGATKPQATIQFSAVDAPVRTIAAWLPITNQALEDMPTLASYIDGRLSYMVLLAEEDGMLNGTGSSADLTGIRSTSGIQTQSYTSTDKAITIGLAISKIETVDGEADGIVINPADYWAILTTRSANSFDARVAVPDGAPFGPPQSTLWGLPCVRSRTQASGTATVGAFRLGAQVFDRSTVAVRITDSHSTYFTENKTVILAEARLAFAVHRPDFFVNAQFS